MSKIPSLFSKTTLAVGVLAASAVVAASTFAMPGGGAIPGMGRDCTTQAGPQDKAQWQGRFQEMRAQRLAALKDKLQLQASQEAAWASFTEALPARASMERGDRQAAREAFKAMTAPERMDLMLARADERRATMVQRAEAVKQFYAQLSAEQRQVFDAEAVKFLRGHRHHGQQRVQI